MATSLVVGIFPDSDHQALESALSAQQIDPSRVKVISANAPDPEDESTQLVFVDVIADMESNSLSDDMTHGTGVLPDSGGTGVPGISSGGTGPQATLESFTHHEAASLRYLEGLGIPEDERENFGDAVADGRSVVLYSDAGSDAQTVAAAFKAAGLRNVREY
ncbi:MAG: hypothetical protein JOZ77_09505 [Candidatus Eremiobacteraeota bacterium]|nr:hypothetical protein [Candidatus Eremiobacteraeota bacterium]